MFVCLQFLFEGVCVKESAITCCNYQKQLIVKYAQTRNFNESNLIDILEGGVKYEKNNINQRSRLSTTPTTSYLLSDDEDVTNYDQYIRTRKTKNDNYNFQEGENQIRFKFQFKNFVELELTTDDLTELNVDAVVNLTKIYSSISGKKKLFFKTIF